MGSKIIVVEPKSMAEWDNLEELVKEYDIKLAIHNHGTGSTYGDPETVKKILAARDPRIGVCLDIGWVTAAGFDAAKVFREYNGRVFDMHLKDKRVEPAAPVAADAAGDKKGGKKAAGPTVLDVEIGTGQANYQGLFAEMVRRDGDRDGQRGLRAGSEQAGCGRGGVFQGEREVRGSRFSGTERCEDGVRLCCRGVESGLARME
jgi:hypothetical protein